MNQEAYKQALAELETPITRIKSWVDLLQKQYHAPLKEAKQEYFERIVRSVDQLVIRLPELRTRTDEEQQVNTFDDDLGAPVMQITGYAEILLAELRHQHNEDEVTIMCREYLDDIRAAGDYLAALIRNAQINLYLEHNNDQTDVSKLSPS